MESIENIVETTKSIGLGEMIFILGYMGFMLTIVLILQIIIWLQRRRDRKDRMNNRYYTTHYAYDSYRHGVRPRRRCKPNAYYRKRMEEENQRYFEEEQRREEEREEPCKPNTHYLKCLEKEKRGHFKKENQKLFEEEKAFEKLSEQQQLELMRREGILTVDKASGVAFELLLKDYFESQGYKVRTTNVVSDFGADLVLEKEASKLLIQAKRSSAKVGVEAIQEIIGAKYYYADEDCLLPEGIVITNSYFTPNASKLAAKAGIVLRDREWIIRNITRETPEEIGQANEEFLRIAEMKTCPLCQGRLVLKINHQGHSSFAGCSNYSKNGCEYTDTYNYSKTEQINTAITRKRSCPTCGRSLILKQNGKILYIDCTGYPQCRYYEKYHM